MGLVQTEGSRNQGSNIILALLHDPSYRTRKSGVHWKAWESPKEENVFNPSSWVLFWIAKNLPLPYTETQRPLYLSCSKSSFAMFRQISRGNSCCRTSSTAIDRKKQQDKVSNPLYKKKGWGREENRPSIHTMVFAKDVRIRKLFLRYYMLVLYIGKTEYDE